MDITLFGAGYVTLLLAIYLIIISIGNPDYFRMWWKTPDDVSPKQRWGLTIGNFLEFPREKLSDISVVLYASLPVFVAIVAFFVRRSIVKGK